MTGGVGEGGEGWRGKIGEGMCGGKPGGISGLKTVRDIAEQNLPVSVDAKRELMKIPWELGMVWRHTTEFRGGGPI